MSSLWRPHLPASAVDELSRLYANSRLGLQELYAKILDDVPGALWRRDLLEALRRTSVPELRRIVVAIDPAASNNTDSDETGIVVAGVDGRDEPHGYTLDDLSLRGSPHDWASAAIVGYHRWKADLIVAEANNGGDMVAAVIHAIDRGVPVKLVHASRDKHTPGRSRWPPSTSRAAGTTWASSDPSKTSSAAGTRAAIRRAPTASTPWSGQPPSSSSTPTRTARGPGCGANQSAGSHEA